VTTSARITHAVPGRVRLKVAGPPEEVAEILSTVESRAHGREGVSSVESDLRTGSVLLRFDPDALDPEAAIELLREAHAALAELVPPQIREPAERSVSQVAAGLERRFATADASVLRATRGVVDLRMLLPIGLAGLSLRQLARTGPQLKAIPWYVLAYYSFDSFLKLHHEAAPTPRDDSG
jgi:Heavy metal associated domain 2